ncbi:hypothetical protein E3N88_14167 [Mikania micrantha]|uniref:Uncharacterized protein n=1 Tax=Mikania micrantha TaxID=192012 RepID=A0A5N6P205_9ASTR|nr:hypothetical protein E3N88_14167 [Mikania micrantha]
MPELHASAYFSFNMTYMLKCQLTLVESMREMVNVEENRARNGVPDSLKSKNEEKYKNIKVKKYYLAPPCHAKRYARKQEISESRDPRATPGTRWPR